MTAELFFMSPIIWYMRMETPSGTLYSTSASRCTIAVPGLKFGSFTLTEEASAIFTASSFGTPDFHMPQPPRKTAPLIPNKAANTAALFFQ